jgi:hypothetical protein
MSSGTTLARDRFGQVIQAMRPGTVQNVAFTTGASAASAAIATSTSTVRLIATADCWVVFGAVPVASATNAARLRADREELFRVDPGDRIAVLGVAASGSLNICEMG